MMRPFFTFYGGKWRAAPKYPQPRYDTVIEPFAGSAGFSVRNHARRVILVEKDPIIAATWRYLLRVLPSEILALPDIEPGQSVHDLGVSQEAGCLIGWWLTRGAAAPNVTRSAWGRDGRYSRQFWGDSARQRIASQVEQIRHWQLIEGDYTEAPDIEAHWFIDPPYQKAGKHYRHGSKALDFDSLGEWCRVRRGDVVACENTGAAWLPFQHLMDAKANEGRTGGKVSREAIWTNMED